MDPRKGTGRDQIPPRCSSESPVPFSPLNFRKDELRELCQCDSVWSCFPGNVGGTKKTEPMVSFSLVLPEKPRLAFGDFSLEELASGPMPLSRPKIFLAIGTILLLVVFTAEFWVQSLAGAVIDQAVIPLARLIVDILT